MSKSLDRDRSNLAAKEAVMALDHAIIALRSAKGCLRSSTRTQADIDCAVKEIEKGHAALTTATEKAAGVVFVPTDSK